MTALGDAGFRAVLPDAAATDRIGAALGGALRPGDVVFLIGAMGAGKSALARAALRRLLDAAGMADETPSPTYTLMQTYEIGALGVIHADLYRLSGADEAAEIGLFDDASAAVLIEWPDRLGAGAPARRLEIAIDIPESLEGRAITVTPLGPDWAPALTAMTDGLNGDQDR